MAILVVVLLALAATVIVYLVGTFRVREARRQIEVRVLEARRDADTYAAEALRQRDLHVATYRYTEADVLAARQQSVAASHAVVSGKVREHLVPLLPEFTATFNPRDARFLGSPVDYVVFNGLDEGEGEIEVVMIEIKTGRSQLSTRERRVRRAVEAGRVRWLEMRLPETVTAEIEVTPPAPATLGWGTVAERPGPAQA